MEPRRFPCSSCGAYLEFAPGLDALRCPYCGTENPIPKVEVEIADRAVEELDFHAHLRELGSREETYEVIVVKCPKCGAETTFDPNITSDECAFCGTKLVSGTASNRLLKPRALLPFKIEREAASELFRKWISGLWFAPNDLKRLARREAKISGMYLPHWTFDSDTTTDWQGKRGEYYYVNETYMENGQRRTRRVRRTRWHGVQGRLGHFFDDVTVSASESLPRQYITALEPWDFNALVPYADEYLSGFRTESYTVPLETGWDHARRRIDEDIDALIRQKIGGDEQQITWKDTRYDHITFKHILLPVWISAYRYRDKVFRFMVNARTGEVQGERPWSWVKITLAVIAVLLVMAVFFYLRQG